MTKAAPTPDKTIGLPQGSGLLETKLYPRPKRANLVARPRITKLLDDGLSASLILVSAPAGFGKTTLLAEWHKNRPHGSCWLSLDAAYADPEAKAGYAYVTNRMGGAGAEPREMAIRTAFHRALERRPNR